MKWGSLLCFLLVACTGTIGDGGRLPDGTRPGENVVRPLADNDGLYVIGVWAQPHDLISEDVYTDGCEYWADLPVICMSAPYDMADIRVYVTEEVECVQNEDGSSTIGLAYGGGTIKMIGQCLFRPDSNYLNYYRMLRNVFAHEVGHQMGMWQHVERSCDDEGVDYTPDGVGICGRAIMNPLVDTSLSAPTGMDYLAFHHRHNGSSVLSAPSYDDDVVCELKMMFE